jgi:LPXTG-site transpeptidase (sortase) family protein
VAARTGRLAGLSYGFARTGARGWVALGAAVADRGARRSPPSRYEAARPITSEAPVPEPAPRRRALSRGVLYLRLGLDAWCSLPGRLRRKVDAGQAYRRFVGGMGNTLAAFGLTCLTVGGGLRLHRHVVLVAAAEQPAPVFEEVALAPAVSAPGEAPGLAPPDRIVIPSIRVDDDVTPVGWSHVFNGEERTNVWETANYAAGYHTTSAPPGAIGNTVISGHNNIAGSVFRDLHKLEQGQRLALFAGGRRYDYAVEASFVVEEAGAPPEQRMANARWIEPTADERLTLVSCYPPWSNTHRAIVVARPIPSPHHSDDSAASGSE